MKAANASRRRSSGRSRPASRPQPPHASICHGVCGPWPRKKFDAIAASAPTAKPRRGPSATPEAATITVTGWTLGIGAKSTRPAAARPPSVATSVRSRAETVPPSSHANPATRTATAASSVAIPPRAGSSAAQAASASAAAAARAGDPRRQRAPPEEPLVFLKHKVRSAGAPAARGRGSRRRPPSPTRRTPRATRRARAFRSGSTPRVGSSRMSTSGSATATAARASRSRSPLERSRGWRPAAQPSPTRSSAAPSPLFIPVHGERDLVEHRLPDEVTARILREIAGAPSHLDRARLRLEQAGGDPRERRLAGAVRPLEHDDLAAADVEVDALEHRHRLPVGERDAAKRKRDLARESLCFRNTSGRPARALRRQPLERLGARRRRGRSGPRRRRPPASRARAPARRGAPRARPSRRAARRPRGRARRRPGRAGRSARRAAAAAARARAPRRGRRAAARRRRARSSSGPRGAARRRMRAPARRAARSRPASTPRFSSPNATSFATIVITTWSSGSWKTVATVPASSAGRAVRVSSPATTTRPAKRPPWKCGTSPASARSSVDLPEPEGPSSATTSPGSSSSETPAQRRRSGRVREREIDDGG